MPRPIPQPQLPRKVVTLSGDTITARTDEIAVEEPLEIRLAPAADPLTFQRAAVTMRTPGADAELALGFLFAEGIIRAAGDVVHIAHCLDPDITAEQLGNVLTVTLQDDVVVDMAPLERHFTTTSACGVCGKAGLEQLTMRGVARIVDDPPVMHIPPALLYALPDRLRAAQGTFDATGGLHAAGLFDAAGTLLAVREDVGRHNALDKLVGWALTEGMVPLAGHIVLVSGRASYELVQKCAVAGVPVMAAVGAPSSLAVETAEAFGITLVGFVRGERANVYAGVGRVTNSCP